MCGLPIAALLCKAIRLGQEARKEESVEVAVEEAPFCVEPGAARKAEERLDEVLVEIRKLCEVQRQVVLDEAAQGHDCGVEGQELNRLMEMEEDLARELSQCRGEILECEDSGEGQEPIMRVRALQERGCWRWVSSRGGGRIRSTTSDENHLG